jgi:hypothetical protein
MQWAGKIESRVVRVLVAWDSQNPLDMCSIWMHYEKVVVWSINVMIGIKKIQCEICVMGNDECGVDSI